MSIEEKETLTAPYSVYYLRDTGFNPVTRQLKLSIYCNINDNGCNI